MLAFTDPLPARPRRIAVAGVSGTGKTTLAAQIARIADAPHTEIDGLFHGPDWTPRPQFLDDVAGFVAAEAWTTEWQYGAARPLLTARADLFVWLDLPFWRTTLPRVLRRTVGRRVRREVLWNGNIEPAFRTFFTDPEHIVRWAVATRKTYRERVPRVEAENPRLIVVRLRSASEVAFWLDGPLASACR